jgi:hypothetical protein
MGNLKERNKYLFKRWSSDVKQDLHYTDFDEELNYVSKDLVYQLQPKPVNKYGW